MRLLTRYAGFVAALLFAPLAKAESAVLTTQSLNGHVAVRSWKSLRDSRVVKQDKDYSCGAASLATLLSEYYGQHFSEDTLLKALDRGEGRASFDDMQRALAQFGFRAQGFAANFEQLVKLRMPLVVYLKHRKDSHFSVLRGINDQTVWLADPSLGNRTYGKAQFLEMWNTRGEDQEHAELKGKFLAVLPMRSDTEAAADFFTKSPVRQTSQAVQQAVLRPLP